MFHREGQQILIISIASLIAINLISTNFIDNQTIHYLIFSVTLVVFILVAQFFRNPKRKYTLKSDTAFSPVDGKVVTIEEVFESEILKKKCIQVSIFMSPLNVHVTRYPLSGEVVYSKYHKGKFLVAWHPKSSEENERTTVAVKTEKFGTIAYRQIAGAVARRIINYAKDQNEAIQCSDSKIEVKIEDVVKGGLSPIATI